MSVTKLNRKVYYFDTYGYTETAAGVRTQMTPSHIVKPITDQVTFGTNIPNWRFRLRNHISATTPMTGSKFLVKVRFGSSSYRDSAGNYTGISGPVVDQSCINSFTVSTVMSSEADQQARTKLLDKYISIKSSWRGGNFLAEIAETIEMFKHPVRAFYHSTYDFAGKIGKLRRVYRKRPTDYLKALSDAWLAFVFGAKPLASDCNDLANTLNGMADRQFVDTRRISARGRQTTQISSVGTAAETLSGPIVGFPQDFWEKTDLSVFYKGEVLCRPQNANLFLIEQFGMSVFDAAPAVWEAIPWSFFIDYFLNVQTMIDSMRYANADFAWLNRTYRNARTVNASPWHHKQNGYGTWDVSIHGGGGYRLAVYVNRIGVPEPPYPSWTFRIPGLSSMKWLNIAALSKQVQYAKGH